MGGDDHRCEWRDRAEALEARLAQVEATLEKLQRHQFGARSEKMQPVAEAIRDPARAEAERRRTEPRGGGGQKLCRLGVSFPCRLTGQLVEVPGAPR
jgi:hypothetical protein